MTRLLSPARILFGLAIAFFGLEYLLHGSFLPGLPPVPSLTPGAPALAYLLGALLLVSGLGVTVLHRWTAACALIIGGLYLAAVLFLHLPHLPDIIHNGSVRTGTFEALAIAGVALAFAALLRPSDYPVRHVGRVLFAVSLLVFAQLHFQYTAFVATLIPAWIPGHLFFAWFTGACFLAAGIAIAADILRPLAALLTSLMFLLWVLLLHLPRVVHAPKNMDELVSAVVALTLAAGSVAVAAPPRAS